MAWLTRPSGKRYLYISHWDRQTQKTITRYIPLDQAEPIVQSLEQKAERRDLAREARAAYRAVRDKQRQKPT
jgi:hypothetical protein